MLTGRRSRWVVFLSVAGALGAAGAITSTGCGSSSTTVPSEGGEDSAPDGTGDGTTGNEAATDASDASVGDGGDASHAGEASVDAEAGADAAEASTDASDGSTAESGPGAPSMAPALPHAIDEVFCARLQQCCGVSSAQWAPNCPALYDGIGGYLGLGRFPLDSGLLAYDASAASGCLADFSSLDCTTDTSATLKKLYQDCYGAITGTVTDGGGCSSSIECSAGQYCKTVADSGSCVPLAGLGQPCSDTANSLDCSYLGNGNPGLYCAPGDAGPTCQNAQPVEAGCSSGVQCLSFVCDYPSCQETYPFVTPGKGLCALLTIVDAGASD